MNQLVPDFLDLSTLISNELLVSLKLIPHEIIDNFGNTLSAHQRDELPNEYSIISIDNVPVAKARTSKPFESFFSHFISSTFANEFRSVNEANIHNATQLVSDDLEKILRLSELENLSFEDQLKHLLKILRSHVWTERGSIFGIYDGFTLEGLAGVGGQDQHNWKMTFASLAGDAATKRKVLHTEDPKSEPNFKLKEGIETPRNLVCFPLLHGSTLVGVMNFSNKIGGQFSPFDLKIIERFAYVAAHLLQKHYFQKRMKSFEKTSDHLGKYLSSKVVKNVKSLNQIELGGIEKKVVCLFSDIRGYTSITEGISAPRLVELLNFHFEKMTAIIDKYEGTVDKIVGDLIMAVWNIPNDQPEPELLAMKCALEMQKEMIRTVIPEWQKNEVAKVGMGVGVNSGMALAGNLGSSRFMNYTVIGDAINTAQRLETKAQSGEIWMAESMFEYVSGKIEKPIRKESSIRLKGKDKTIDAYVYRPLSY